MRKIIIDDNKLFVDSIKANGDFCYTNYNNEGKSELSLLADYISHDINDVDVLFININLKIENSKRQDFKGIELLKWLRLKNVNNYCVAYSFLNPSNIIKENPLNSILFSRGVTYIQAPFIFSDIMFKNEEVAESVNLLPFFRSEIDLKRIRHEFANNWGAKRMNWLLDIDIENPKPNFFMEILKYITPIDNQKEIDKQELTQLINDFNPNGKKIFYYDDCADIWEPSLQKIFGKDNISTFSPKDITKEKLVSLIIRKKPGCLLLDLRLENEKDIKNVLDYSGGSLLIELKKKFITLPIIMFTASNKAESLRQLLEAGAEYVWTKEGVDDGINNELTLNNTVNLVNEVQKCLAKYKNKIYEKIYEAECKLSVINTSDKQILNNIENGPLKFVNSIYLDTNYLIDTLEEGCFDLFYKLLITNKNANRYFKMKIIIHTDIYSELFVLSKKDENAISIVNGEERANKDRVPASKFLLEKLIQWHIDGLIYEETFEGQDIKIKEIAKYELPTISNLNLVEEFQDKRRNIFEKLFENFEEKRDLQISEINKQIETINQTIESYRKEINTKIPDFSSIILNADTTFLKVIPKSLEKGGVIFVGNDKDCAFNIGQIFLNKTYSNQIKRDYRKAKQKIANEPKKMGVYSASLKINENKFYLYQHLESKDFNEFITKELSPKG